MTEKAYFQNQVKKNRQVINEGPQLIMYEYDRSLDDSKYSDSD